jgi:hypothetical protein
MDSSAANDPPEQLLAISESGTSPDAPPRTLSPVSSTTMNTLKAVIYEENRTVRTEGACHSKMNRDISLT